MPPNLLKYSNGWGHLIMSLASMAVAIVLLLLHDPTLNGVAIGLIVSVQGSWFVTSAANSMRHVQVQQPAAPPAAGGGLSNASNP